ncbi:hypothetical protein D3C73_1451610 [compost metagenome]
MIFIIMCLMQTSSSSMMDQEILPSNMLSVQVHVFLLSLIMLGSVAACRLDIYTPKEWITISRFKWMQMGSTPLRNCPS